MRNLIFLFIRFGGVILFFSLEVVCMFLVVEFNQKQKDIYAASSNRIVGGIYNKKDDVLQYLNLSEENERLSAENARLYAELDNAKYIKSSREGTVYEEEYAQSYTYIGAKVINNSVVRPNNYLTLDKGRNFGIAPGMGVISDFGVVGIVTSVSEKFAAVMSILHSQSRISGAVKRNKYHGGIVWDTKNPRKVNLVDIPKHALLNPGDTIQTTGYSAVFPEGIIIGTIDTSWVEEGSSFHEVLVNLSIDLSNIQYVSVVNNLDKKELEELESSSGGKE